MTPGQHADLLKRGEKHLFNWLIHEFAYEMIVQARGPPRNLKKKAFRIFAPPPLINSWTPHCCVDVRRIAKKIPSILNLAQNCDVRSLVTISNRMEARQYVSIS